MRRTIVIVVALVAIGAAAAAAVIALERPAAPAAAAVPLRPTSGHATDIADASLLAGPLDRFGLELLAREAAAQSTGNVVVSPLSVDAALSLVLNGAGGRTADEMRRTLGLEGMSTATADQAWADLLAEVQAGATPSVQVADSLWLRGGVAFAPAFLAAARQSFAAATEALPTDPNAAADAINDWTGQHTAGLIKDIVDSGDFTGPAPVVLTVVNALHAKAAWATPFEAGATALRPFTLADGTTVQVPTMSGELSAPVAQTAAYDAVALATRGSLTAWVVVPRTGRTATSVLQSLQSGGLAPVYDAAQRQSVILDLPKLHTSFGTADLTPALEAMGMVAAFSPASADLTGIVTPAALAQTGNLSIAWVMHKAVLSVNENGVEAAAATAVGVVGSAAPIAQVTITADHPFLLALTDTATRAPLFLALIRDPRA
jgi:serpin B